MTAALEPLLESRLAGLKLRHRGKVRDIYDVDDRHLLIVTTDRLSAFDVVLPTPIPGKGAILTAVSNFWFDKLSHIVPNHISGIALDKVLKDPRDLAQARGRAIVVKKLKGLPVEAVVRGYLIGSGWKDYQSTGAVCGIKLPAGLKLADKLPNPIFTPSTKAEVGTHDENISFEQVAASIGREMAERVRGVSLRLYKEAAEHALARGIIIADTKFEFGLDERGTLTLMDEALTPDSSRFWPADSYKPGVSPPSYDKQFVRDYLETLDWNKKAPGPKLPDDIARRTADKYREALERLTGGGQGD